MKIHKKPNVMAYFEHGDDHDDDDDDVGFPSVANFSSFSLLSHSLFLSLSLSLLLCCLVYHLPTKLVYADSFIMSFLCDKHQQN